MNKKQKKAIDRSIGFVLCIILRIPALCLEMILKRKHDMPPTEAPQRIVVAKYMGIGSILQATPLLKGLKDKYPDSQLIFVSLASNKDLLSHYEFIDDILCVDDSSIFCIVTSSLGVIIQLILKRVDLFLNLEVHSTYGSLMCLLSSSKNRLGFSLEDRDHKAFMYTHLLYLNTDFPIRYCYIQLGRLAGINTPSNVDEPICPTLSEIDLERVSGKIEAIFNFKHKGIIVINPNASDLRYERRWSRQNFADIASHFMRQGYAIALVGSSSEFEYVEGVIKLINGDASRIRNLAGFFSLIDFFAFLKSCSLVLTNDSGVMNMALTLPVPQLLLAGPVSPEQYFVPNEFRTYIYYQTYCSPCTHYVETPPCAGDNICMQLIRPQEVIGACERLLRGENVSPKLAESFTYHSEVLGVLKDRGNIIKIYNEQKL